MNISRVAFFEKEDEIIRKIAKREKRKQARQKESRETKGQEITAEERKKRREEMKQEMEEFFRTPPPEGKREEIKKLAAEYKAAKKYEPYTEKMEKEIKREVKIDDRFAGDKRKAHRKGFKPKK